MRLAKEETVETRIGALVRSRRLAAGLTQEDLGTKIGVSYQQVQKYETGANRVSSSALMRIAAALGTTASEMMAEIERS